jgi:hypothetical protein
MLYQDNVVLEVCNMNVCWVTAIMKRRKRLHEQNKILEHSVKKSLCLCASVILLSVTWTLVAAQDSTTPPLPSPSSASTATPLSTPDLSPSQQASVALTSTLEPSSGAQDASSNPSSGTPTSSRATPDGGVGTGSTGTTGPQPTTRTVQTSLASNMTGSTTAPTVTTTGSAGNGTAGGNGTIKYVIGNWEDTFCFWSSLLLTKSLWSIIFY